MDDRQRECVARVCEHDAVQDRTGQGKARQAQESKKVGSMIIRMGWVGRTRTSFAPCRCLDERGGEGCAVDGRVEGVRADVRVAVSGRQGGGEGCVGCS
jgi:hypothetical protein